MALSRRLTDTGLGIRTELDDHDTQLAQIVPSVLTNRYVRGLAHVLDAGEESAVLLVQGDSTGNGTYEWPYLIAQWLGEQYPDYTVLHKLWSDTHQNYSGAYTTIQTGSDGDAYALLPGGVGNYINTPDAAKFDITGDIEFCAKVACDDWTNGASQMIFGKMGGNAHKSYAFAIRSTGYPYIWWSTDGTALVLVQPTVQPTLVNGTAYWFKATLDVDNGAGGYEINFYYGTDGVTFTKIGDTIVGASTTSIFVSDADLEIGSYTTGAGGVLAGKFYEGYIKSGINGKIVAHPVMELAHPTGTTTFEDLDGNTWTVNGTVTVGHGSPGIVIMNASLGGQDLADVTDVTRFALQTILEPVISFINLSHNEDTTKIYQSDYEGLATQLLTAYPNTGVVCVTQNPQLDPRTADQILSHALRNRQIVQAAVKNNYGLIDVYRAFVVAGAVAYTEPDGVHPNLAGCTLWKNEVVKFLKGIDQ